jgi:hypothetical protein
MEDDLIAEIRLMLEQMVVPDLKLLLDKVDALQRQLELNRRAAQDHLDALQLEVAAMRGEMKAFRSEMESYRAGFRSPIDLSAEQRSPEVGSSGDDPTSQTAVGKKYRVN